MPRVIFAHFRSHRRLYSCCARCRTSSPCASHLFASAPARPVLPLPARGRRAASPRRLCAPPLRGAPALLRLQQRLHFGLPLVLHRHLRCVLGLCLLRRLPRLVEHADARRLGRRLCANLADELSTLHSLPKARRNQKHAAGESAPQAKARRRRRAPRSGGGPGAAPPASSEWVGVGVYLSMPVGMPCAIVLASV